MINDGLSLNRCGPEFDGPGTATILQPAAGVLNRHYLTRSVCKTVKSDPECPWTGTG